MFLAEGKLRKLTTDRAALRAFLQEIPRLEGLGAGGFGAPPGSGERKGCGEYRCTQWAVFCWGCFGRA